MAIPENLSQIQQGVSSHGKLIENFCFEVSGNIIHTVNMEIFFSRVTCNISYDASGEKFNRNCTWSVVVAVVKNNSLNHFNLFYMNSKACKSYFKNLKPLEVQCVHVATLLKFV